MIFNYKKDWRAYADQLRDAPGGGFKTKLNIRHGDGFRETLVAGRSPRTAPASICCAAILDRLNRDTLPEAVEELNKIQADNDFRDGWARGMTWGEGWSLPFRRRASLVVARAIESEFDEFRVEYETEDRDEGHVFKLSVDEGLKVSALFSAVVNADEWGQGVRVFAAAGNVEQCVAETLERIDGESVDDSTDVLNKLIVDARAKYDDDRLRAYHKIATALARTYPRTTSLVYPDGFRLYYPSWKSDFQLIYRV